MGIKWDSCTTTGSTRGTVCGDFHAEFITKGDLISWEFMLSSGIYHAIIISNPVQKLGRPLGTASNSVSGPSHGEVSNRNNGEKAHPID